ncbi:MAG: hypothetical protein M9958_00850 [Chitinophagales bacterium]|nr:hypothetical protein [Chitinophagales bacterium]
MLLIITYFTYGFHYGWIDDVLQSNYLKGIGLAAPAKQMYTNQVLISRLYYELYKLIPDKPWYGYFSVFYLTVATTMLIYLLTRLFNNFYRNNLFFFIFFIASFYLLFWMDSIILVNFTKTSILLVGVSVLLLHNTLEYDLPSIKRKVKIFLCLIFLLLGFLNRLEVALLWTVPFIIYLWRYKDKASYKVIKLFVFTVFLSVLIYKIQTSPEIQANVEKISHIQNLTDGKNVYNESFSELSNSDFRYKSIFLYYWPDSTLISDSLLSKWGSNKLYSIYNLRNIPLKVAYEVHKAKDGYNEEYSEGSNWWYNYIFLLFINFILGVLFFVFYKRKNPQLIYNHTAFLIAIIGLLSVVLLFYKLESRVALPSITIISLVSLVTLSQLQIKSLSNQRKWLILFVLVPIIAYQHNKYIQISIDRKHEEELKRNFITEINHSFTDKILLFDIWSLSLLHTSLLGKVELNATNKYITHFESWSNFVPDNVRALNRICQCSDFISFYDCISQNKEKFVFVMTEELRHNFIEEYALEMHNYKLRFKKLPNLSALNQIHYSLMPGRYDFNYYYLDTFEKNP